MTNISVRNIAGWLRYAVSFARMVRRARSVQVGLWLDVELLARIDALLVQASGGGIPRRWSRSAVLRDLLERGLETLESSPLDLPDQTPVQVRVVEALGKLEGNAGLGTLSFHVRASPRAIRKAVSRALRSGKVVRVKRGVYRAAKKKGRPLAASVEEVLDIAETGKAPADVAVALGVSRSTVNRRLAAARGRQRQPADRLDEPLLESLRVDGPAGPSELVSRLLLSRSRTRSVRRRLKVLVADGLVRRVRRGVYEAVQMAPSASRPPVNGLGAEKTDGAKTTGRDREGRPS